MRVGQSGGFVPGPRRHAIAWAVRAIERNYGLVRPA